MKRWLVTAFEPFAGAQTNSSLVALESMKHFAMNWGQNLRIAAPLPVTFADAWPRLLQEIERDPGVNGVLAMGQAEGRMAVSLEQVALNWIDAGSPDNAGVKIERRRVLEGGPEVYWSNIPWERFIRPKNCAISYSAGVFVCNQLMFQLMKWANENGKFGGFIHIPLLASQPGFEGRPRLDDERAFSVLKQALDFLVAL